jgi:iron complex outermembrane receptor protein
MKKKRNRVLLCTTVIAVLGGASQAMAGADALDDAVSTPAAEGSEQSLQEVVVTAQRRSELLENVPMSISVVTPQTVTNAGITNFMELGQVTTGTMMSWAGGTAGVSIRGVSSLIAGYNIEPNVAVYIDGMYQPQTITMPSELANLEGIEILKGPQGTLYGRNATGGAILINTLGPSDTFTGKFDASGSYGSFYGGFGEGILNGYVAGPITDRIRFSVTAHYQAGNSNTRMSSPTVIGEANGPAVDYDMADVRFKLQADVTDKLQATLGLNVDYLEDPRANMYSVYSQVAEPFAPPPLRSTVFGEEAFVDKPRLGGQTDESTLKLVYDTPIGVLTEYTGFARRRLFENFQFDATYLNIVSFDVRYREDTFQESVDYAINAVNDLDLLIGGLYYRDKFFTPDTNEGIEILGFGGVFSDNSLQTQYTTSEAGYVDATYHLTSQLSLNAGGRYSSDHRQMDYETVGPGGVFIEPPISGEHTWSAFTPRASIRYELAPRTDVYFTYSEGYRSGAYNPTGPAAPGLPLTPVAPETIHAYEVGFKAAWSLIQFDTALFRYDYRNLQVAISRPDPLDPGAVISDLENAQSATISGWDAEATAMPTNRLTLHAGVEWLHARFGSFPNATGTGVNATNTLNIGGQVQNWSGLEMARAPDYSGHVGADYVQPFSYGSLLFTTNLSFTDSYVLGSPSTYGPLAPAPLQNQQRFLQPAYALLSAQAGWTDPSKRFTFTVFGNNLTNRHYFLTLEGGPFGTWSIPADPITYGARVAYKF